MPTPKKEKKKEKRLGIVSQGFPTMLKEYGEIVNGYKLGTLDQVVTHSAIYFTV